MPDSVVKLSPAQFRQHFPALDAAPHFASCSQGALSDHLAHTMQQLTASLMKEQAPWGTWMDKVEEYRARSAFYFGAEADQIAVLNCASEAAFQVVTSLDWAGERNQLVTSDLEFPSIGNVWRAQAQAIEVVNVRGLSEALFAENWIPLITERTKLVSVPWVSYVNGTRPDVETIIAHAHSVGARVIVDAYQGAGVVPLDVAQIDCDFMMTGNLKYMLGLPGIASLYVHDPRSTEIPAILTGWFGRVNPFAFNADRIDFPDNARRFEVGAHAIPSAYAGVAGLDMLDRVNPHEIWNHVIELRETLAEELTGLGYSLDQPSDPSHRGPQVAIISDDPERLATELARSGIGTSPRGSRLRQIGRAHV